MISLKPGIAFCGLRNCLWSNWGRYDPSGQGCIGSFTAFLCSYNLISQGLFMSNAMYIFELNVLGKNRRLMMHGPQKAFIRNPASTICFLC